MATSDLLVNFLFVAVLWHGGENEMENSLS